MREYGVPSLHLGKILLLIPRCWINHISQPVADCFSFHLNYVSRYLQHIYLTFGFSFHLSYSLQQSKHSLRNSPQRAYQMHFTNRSGVLREKNQVQPAFAWVNLFCEFLVAQRPKACLVNAWRLSRSQVPKVKVKKPHVHCEHSSCLHGNSVCVSPVYMICGLSWSGSPCDQGWKTYTALISSASDLQSATINLSANASADSKQTGQICVKSACSEKKFFLFCDRHVSL